MTPIIYKQEISDGLTEKIINGMSLNYNSLLENTDSFNLSESVLNHLKACDCTKEDDTFELAYRKSLLLSTIINANDDYMHPEEVWPARYSAKAKPFNIEHESHDIIGHMIGSYAVDDSGQIISDNTPIDELPEKYHIIDNSIIYKWWRDEKKREKIATLLAEIDEGQWYVSVEALFPNFDYGLLASDGTLQIVKRNKQTSFLTKYLRAYDGSGVYQDYKIVRVPRNMTFSGKGLVKNPANKENGKKLSIILAKDNNFKLIAKELVYLENDKGEKMEDKVKDLEKKNSELSATIETLTASVKTLTDSKEAIVLEKNKVETNLDSIVKELNEAKASLSTLQKFKEDLETKYNEISEINKKLKEDNDNFLKAKVKADRLVIVASKLNLRDEAASKFVDTLVSLTDEQFNAQVEAVASIKPETKVSKEIIEKIDETNKEKTTPTLSLNHESGVEKIKNINNSIASFVDALRKSK